VKILHAFADHGVESETLQKYGEVVRVGLEPRDTNESTPLQADVKELPFAEDTQFDFGLFHPPCTKWSDMPDADKESDAENLIPLAREVAQKYCDYWAIENKPRAPLRNPIYLTGKMFGLPIEYKRAFETNYEIGAPPMQTGLESETSPFFYTEKSAEWWAAIKGVSPEPYTKHALAKNSIPAAYVRCLIRSWFRASELGEGASDYSNYDKRKDAERARAQNHTLDKFNGVAADGGACDD
jgi:hypothetical protein